MYYVFGLLLQWVLSEVLRYSKCTHLKYLMSPNNHILQVKHCLSYKKMNACCKVGNRQQNKKKPRYQMRHCARSGRDSTHTQTHPHTALQMMTGPLNICLRLQSQLEFSTFQDSILIPVNRSAANFLRNVTLPAVSLTDRVCVIVKETGREKRNETVKLSGSF